MATLVLPLLTTLVQLLLSARLPQGGVELAPGGPAPALARGIWLDGRPAVELGGGRAVVLVFWATWCGACLAEFPRLNELVRELEGEPIDFVTVADEPRAAVEALLASRKLAARVLLDDGGRTFDAYGVRVLPRLVLVDPTGKVAALPRLADVDADVLRALAAGERVDLPLARLLPADLEWDERKVGLDAARSLGHVWLEPSEAAGGGVRFPPDHGRITADGAPFGALVQLAWGAQPYEITSTHPRHADTETRYRLSVKAPDDSPETARAMLREHLARVFAVQGEWTERAEPTPILRRAPGRELARIVPSNAAKAGGMARSGAIQMQKVRFESIASSLGSFGLGRGLIDETGLAGEFDVDLTWTPGDAAGFRRALEGAGLMLVDEERTVRKLQVSALR